MEKLNVLHVELGDVPGEEGAGLPCGVTAAFLHQGELGLHEAQPFSGELFPAPGLVLRYERQVLSRFSIQGHRPLLVHRHMGGTSRSTSIIATVFIVLLLVPLLPGLFRAYS